MAQGFTKGIPIDIDGTLSGNTDTLVSSQKAVKTYVDTKNNLKINVSGDTMTGGLITTSLSATTLSASTIYSGSTDLSNVFVNKQDSKYNFTSWGSRAKNRYYSYANAPTLSIAAAISQNTIKFYPIQIDDTINVTRIGFTLALSAASGYVRLGIYDSLSGYPNNVVYDSGNIITSATTGAKLVSGFTQTLTPALYYLSLISNNATNTASVFGTQSNNNIMGYLDLPAAVTSITHYTKSQTFGAFSGHTGGASGLTEANTSTTAVWIYIE